MSDENLLILGKKNQREIIVGVLEGAFVRFLKELIDNSFKNSREWISWKKLPEEFPQKKKHEQSGGNLQKVA